VAVEEKSVIDYNLGNPDGVLQAGEEPRPPRTRLVAIYPSEGTLFSDNPFYVLDAEWVSKDERGAAAKFEEYVQRPENQRKVLRYGFRPGNPQVAVGDPISRENGVDPDQPQTLLEVPSPAVMVGLLDQWAENRKSARVLVVLDVSGSMGDPAAPGGYETKLDLAKQAAIEALGDFKSDDEVGLRIFSTQMGPDERGQFVDLQPIAPIGPNRERLAQSIRDLTPVAGTPLFDVARTSFSSMVDAYDPARINAVILLTDGMNDDGDTSDDRAQLKELVTSVRDASQGEQATPVRMFTIGYGTDADNSALGSIAEASNAAAYNATDATTIRRVFAQVVSNF
jgi:Ca-activated chloride channel family protein